MFVGVERELRLYISSYLTSELRLPPLSTETAQDLGFGMGDRLAEPTKGQTQGEQFSYVAGEWCYDENWRGAC